MLVIGGGSGGLACAKEGKLKLNKINNKYSGTSLRTVVGSFTSQALTSLVDKSTRGKDVSSSYSRAGNEIATPMSK